MGRVIVSSPSYMSHAKTNGKHGEVKLHDSWEHYWTGDEDLASRQLKRPLLSPTPAAVEVFAFGRYIHDNEQLSEAVSAFPCCAMLQYHPGRPLRKFQFQDCSLDCGNAGCAVQMAPP